MKGRRHDLQRTASHFFKHPYALSITMQGPEMQYGYLKKWHWYGSPAIFKMPARGEYNSAAA